MQMIETTFFHRILFRKVKQYQSNSNLALRFLWPENKIKENG